MRLHRNVILLGTKQYGGKAHPPPQAEKPSESMKNFDFAGEILKKFLRFLRFYILDFGRTKFLVIALPYHVL